MGAAAMAGPAVAGGGTVGADAQALRINVPNIRAILARNADSSLHDRMRQGDFTFARFQVNVCLSP
jgi:hypothetical protein